MTDSVNAPIIYSDQYIGKDPFRKSSRVNTRNLNSHISNSVDMELTIPSARVHDRNYLKNTFTLAHRQEMTISRSISKERSNEMFKSPSPNYDRKKLHQIGTEYLKNYDLKQFLHNAALQRKMKVLDKRMDHYDRNNLRL